MPRNAQSIIDHADQLAARFEAAEPNPISDDGHAAVTRARGAGVSWSVLATVLGTSRQAVQQRYGAQIAEDPSA